MLCSLGRALGVELEVDVDLHGMHAANPVLLDCALEHTGVVRDHQPQVRTARIFAAAEPFEKGCRGIGGQVERGNAECREAGECPSCREPGGRMLDSLRGSSTLPPPEIPRRSGQHNNCGMRPWTAMLRVFSCATATTSSALRSTVWRRAVVRQVLIRGTEFPSVTTKEQPNKVKAPAKPISCIIEAMFAILVSLLRTLRSAFRTHTDLALENLALRQQLAALHRCTPRVRLRRADRAFWIGLSQIWSHWSDAIVIVKPDTVVRWHLAGFRLFWRWKSRSRTPAKDDVSPEVKQLIRRMAEANVTWGAPRIHGEFQRRAA